jgi:predicted Zn-dependent peptidase
MVFSHYNKTVLENGLAIVSEFIPSVRSISLGVWIKTGTRFEELKYNGIAHFLEHMMFKGTRNRSSKEIARSLESVGGNLNAFTTKELTCYFAEILDENLRKAVNVLSDIICYSIFPAQEIEKEKTVVLDEIHALEDTPEELIQESFVEKLFHKHPLSWAILGHEESVKNFDRQNLIQFYDDNYSPQNMLIAAAGNINHKRLVKLLEKTFALPPINFKNNSKAPKSFGFGEYVYHKSINQAHVCLGIPSIAYNHPQKYELLILNTLLGGGMSSRLFQNIREKYGVAYSIYSFLDFYSDSGVFGIYLGTDKRHLNHAVELVENELNFVVKRIISKKVLQEVKSQLKGNLLLSMESTANRMARLAKMEIYMDGFEEIDQIIEKINTVSAESVIEAAASTFTKNQLLKILFIPQN